jgi:formylglycine-generating enzyme required for sulfatase activity
MMTRFSRNCFVGAAIVSWCSVFGMAIEAQEPKTITNSIGMKLVLIPKGTFTMGAPSSEEGSENNERQHEVKLTQDYYLGEFEVTQAQYEKVMGENPSFFQRNKVKVAEQHPPAIVLTPIDFPSDLFGERHPSTGRVVKDVDRSNHPVEQVSWEDAVEFCRRLSALPEEKQAGRVYRLPTEAQWEYACRAGSKTAYSFGENSTSLGDYAWFDENRAGEAPSVDEMVYNAILLKLSGERRSFGERSSRETHPVGQKKPNAWGLYDMHGNVWEWCSDWYGAYPSGSSTDPTGPQSGSFRVYRGGSWHYNAAGCRSAFRGRGYPSYRDDYRGFRVALNSSEIPK